MKDKVCIMIVNDGYYDAEEIKGRVGRLFANIPAEDINNVQVYVDEPKEIEGIRSNFLAQFVFDNLFEAKAIYTDDVISISNDEVEEQIFISLMKLFGIDMYNEKDELMHPDYVYMGEIAKLFHENMEMPECILEATEEKLAEIKCVAVAIMRHLWSEYRVNAKG